MITIDRNININEARAAGGPYFVHHEGEAGGGFYDIALEPRLLDWPDIAHAGLIELKYLKPGGRKPTKSGLYLSGDAPTEAGRYLETAFPLGGNFLAIPIVRVVTINEA